MEIILGVLLALAITVALFYRSKANEFESLFELSKRYETGWNKLPQVSINRGGQYDISFATDIDIPVGTKLRMKRIDSETGVVTARYNKDGSIAKKRGPKAKA